MRSALRVFLACCAIAATTGTTPVQAQPGGAIPDSQTEITNSSDTLTTLTPARQQQLAEYSQLRNVWRFVSFFTGIAIFAIIFLSGLSARFRDWANRLKYRFLAVWAFLVLFLVAEYVLRFPLSFYRSFIVEHQFGFSNQAFGDWLSDGLLSLSVSCVVSIIPMWLFYQMVTRLKRWWFWFAVSFLPILVAATVLSPIFVSPLFNDFMPIEDKQLESELLSLAEQAGIEGADIFQVDASRRSTKVNAYVTGLFNTKRIVLYDTLIENFTHDEIMFVMAHEMGHYVMNHVWWGLVVATVFIMFGLWLLSRLIGPLLRRSDRWSHVSSLSDVASLPLVLLLVTTINFLFQPATNAASRFMERQADSYGLTMSGASFETAASSFRKLSILNLSDPDPNPLIEFWFYTHPSLTSRIAAAREQLADKQSPVATKQQPPLNRP